MPSPHFVFHQGRIVPYSEVKYGVLMHALNYGTAVFAGIRAHWNEDEKQLFIFRPADHFQRFLDSSRLLCMDLPFTADILTWGLAELIRTEGYKADLYIRPLAYYSDEMVGVKFHRPHGRGLHRGDSVWLEDVSPRIAPIPHN